MANSTAEIFRSNLKHYRKLIGLTQEELSELSGISHDYLSEIERGKKTPSFKRIDLLSKALNIDAYMLFKPQQ